jgi:3-isopropylmalate dehydratase small subunit
MISQQKKRKEVSLDTETLTLLQLQAEKEGRKLKNYMEHILKEKANDFVLTDEYKAMMDDLLEQHKKGTINYISKEAFLKQIREK